MLSIKTDRDSVRAREWERERQCGSCTVITVLPPLPSSSCPYQLSLSVCGRHSFGIKWLPLGRMAGKRIGGSGAHSQAGGKGRRTGHAWDICLAVRLSTSLSLSPVLLNVQSIKIVLYRWQFHFKYLPSLPHDDRVQHTCHTHAGNACSYNIQSIFKACNNC